LFQSVIIPDSFRVDAVSFEKRYYAVPLKSGYGAVSRAKDDELMKREYPLAPIAGVAAVIFRDQEVLLVRRGNEPSKGRLGIPGGVVELGETAKEAIVREVEEETGIKVQPLRVLDVFDSIVRDDDGGIRFHYILTEFLCEPAGSELRSSSDVSDAIWAPLEGLDELDVMPRTREFIERVAREEYL
jgi:mutator protein MutT